MVTPEAGAGERTIAQQRGERQAAGAIEREQALIARDALLDAPGNAMAQAPRPKLREIWNRDVQPLAQHLAREGDGGEHAHAACALDHRGPVDLRVVYRRQSSFRSYSHISRMNPCAAAWTAR